MMLCLIACLKMFDSVYLVDDAPLHQYMCVDIPKRDKTWSETFRASSSAEKKRKIKKNKNVIFTILYYKYG
jgi:hypothetical protein